MDLLRLKELIKEKDTTGKDLAAKVGVSPVAISNITNGNSFPRPELLKSIANALDVDIRELFIPTKEALQYAKETLYIERKGEYISIGEIEIKS